MRDEIKCCATCKHCMFDYSTDSIECMKDDAGEWVHQEEEDIFTPQYDYCVDWEKEDDSDFWETACTVLNERR